MEDSPLSITASITGILTFIAAICAFVYVRYNTLQNGNKEMLTILDSVSATIEETRIVAQEKPYGEPIYESEACPPLREPEHAFKSGLREKLIEDLYRTELTILTFFMKAYGASFASMQSNLRPDGNTSATWQDLTQLLETAQEPSPVRRRYLTAIRPLQDYLRVMDVLVDFSPAAAMVWSAVGLVLSFGTTRTMMRWYMVRERVLEQVKQREIIRSRLVYYQVTASNS